MGDTSLTTNPLIYRPSQVTASIVPGGAKTVSASITVPDGALLTSVSYAVHVYYDDGTGAVELSGDSVSAIGSFNVHSVGAPNTGSISNSIQTNCQVTLCSPTGWFSAIGEATGYSATLVVNAVIGYPWFHSSN